MHRAPRITPENFVRYLDPIKAFRVWREYESDLGEGDKAKLALDALRGCSRSIDLDIALDEIITGHSSVNVVPQTPLGIKKDGNSLDGGVYAVSRGKGEYNPAQGPDFGQFREPVREDPED